MYIDEIHDIVQKLTRSFDFNNTISDEEITAKNISDMLKVKRSVASKYLNELYRLGKVIKINTRPVYFFDKNILEQRLGIALNKDIYESIDCMLNQDKIFDRLEEDAFYKIIGYEGSLKYQIEQCKAAISYPPRGIPALIIGETGVGKSFLAQQMYEYAHQHNIIGEDSPFVILNCAEFANNPELLTANLFGYTKGAFTGADEESSGVIEEANNGILFLDEVHRLSPEGQEKLFLFMDKGIYHKLGENKNWQNANVRFIFATTEKPEDTFLGTFLRRIPIIIEIPALKERISEEKLYMIYTFFQNESKSIGKKIYVSHQVLNALMTIELKGNIGELKNIIKHSCAKAYMEYNDFSDSENIKVTLNHLPEEKIQQFIMSDKEKELMNCSYDKGILIDENRTDLREHMYSRKIKRDLQELYNATLKSYKQLIDQNFEFNNFIDKELKSIDTYFDSLIFDNNIYSTDVKFQIVKKVVDNVLKIMKVNYGLSLYGNTAIVLTYYIINFINSKYKEIDNDLIKSLINILQRKCFKEYTLTNKMFDQIQNLLDIEFRDIDKAVFTIYIKGINKNYNINQTRAIIIAHGYSTASSITNVANRLLGQYVFEAFDMPIEIGTEEIVKKLKKYIGKIDTTKGIIILVDMGSLEEIHKSLKDISQGTIGIINNTTTQLAIDTGEKIIKGIELEEILDTVTKVNKSVYKIIRPTKPKKKVLLTTCITGIGTAIRIKKLLDEGFKGSIEIVPYDYLSLKNNGMKDKIFEKYNVIGIFGTTNPNIDNVTFIALEDIISGKDENKLNEFLKECLSDKIANRINDQIVKLFSLQSVLNHLTILNPNKIINDIEIMINNLQIQIGYKFSNSLIISLYVHLSCLIERLIKKTPINEYSNLKEFKEAHKRFINICEKSFKDIEDTYGIAIPVSEIGYIYDIICMRLGALNI